MVVEVEAGGILIVQVERECCVVKLRAHPVGAAKGTGELHLPDDLGRQHFAGLVVLREGLEQLFVAEELFEHLRRHFDEVALGCKAGKTCPLRAPAENGMHQVAELVEVRDDVGVLQQAGIAFFATREVADERCLGQIAATHAGDDRRGGKPLVFAFARMHVEIEAANEFAVLNYFKD